MLPYGRQSISDIEIDAVAAVLRSDWLTTGPLVDEFERRVGELAGGHEVVSCTSGTAALHVAYSAAGVGPGDEVICTPMTFIASASTASMLGASVVFADVDGETGLIDPAAVDALVSPRTRVVTAVDYGGHPADYDALRPIADRAGALLLDDAAHSIGGSYKGRPVGDLADITTFSFFPTKNVTTGEGGAAVFADKALASRAREFHTIGLVRDPERFRLGTEGPWHQEVHEFGLNYRLSDIACALGLAQLGQLDGFRRRRAEIVARYDAAIGEIDGVAIPPTSAHVQPMRHLYPVRILGGRRRSVYEHMRRSGIGVQVNYLPVYWHPVYADRGYKVGLCPNAEAYYSEQLSLPLHPSLTDAEVDWVIDELVAATGGA